MSFLFEYITELAILLFLILTFLQSAIDKTVDWSGNLAWLKEHFSATFLKNSVPLLLIIVLAFEYLASILCSIGAYQLLTNGTKTIALYGAIASILTLLMLLFGQRVAKDYPGAQTITVYFIPTVFLLFLLH